MSKHVVRMEIEEADHYTDEQKAAIVAGYPEHERDARAKGIPVLGSGAVFPIAREFLQIDPFEIPEHWFEIGGLDIGWDHPTAAVRMVWDQDTDSKYVVNDYKRAKAVPLIHAETLKSWGSQLPWAWPPDAGQTEKGTGNNIKDQYETHGLNLTPVHAQFPDGSVSVEAGVMAMLEDMEVGKFKVFKTCNDWFEEQQIYHRKDGKIVKSFDDLMAATRYAYVMLRFSTQVRQRRKPRGKRAYAKTDHEYGF